MLPIQLLPTEIGLTWMPPYAIAAALPDKQVGTQPRISETLAFFLRQRAVIESGAPSTDLSELQMHEPHNWRRYTGCLRAWHVDMRIGELTELLAARAARYKRVEDWVDVWGHSRQRYLDLPQTQATIARTARLRAEGCKC